MSLVKSSSTIGFYTLISRVLGLVRDLTIASALGAAMYSDAFFVSFKIPNFLRRLFAEGAFNAAFVPLYAGTLSEEDGQKKAAQFAEDVYAFLVAVLIAVSAFFILFMPWLMYVLAPGFSLQPQKFQLTVLLTRITMPYIIFISVVCLLGGILNSMGRFAAVAATPIIMNLCLIIVPPLIGGMVPSPAHALSIAVFVAGVAQMLWLMVFCYRLKVLPRLKLPRMTDGVRRLFVLILPAAMGAGVAQINLFVDLIIASSVESGVSYLYYADRISELPLAVIGIAIGTALLPMLSRQVKEGKHAQATHSQNRAIELALLLALPAAVALMVIPQPIIKVIYERGAFTSLATTKTYLALMAFAAGLPAFVLIKVLSPAFYANQDTKTPFKIALVCIAVNFVLNITLIFPFKHVGMAMATSIASWLNVTLMLHNLRKRKLFSPDALLLARLPRMAIACACMAAALFVAAQLLDGLLGGHTLQRVTGLSLLVGTGGLIYCLGATVVRAYDTEQLKKLVRRG